MNNNFLNKFNEDYQHYLKSGLYREDFKEEIEHSNIIVVLLFVLFLMSIFCIIFGENNKLLVGVLLLIFGVTFGIYSKKIIYKSIDNKIQKTSGKEYISIFSFLPVGNILERYINKKTYFSVNGTNNMMESPHINNDEKQIFNKMLLDSLYYGDLENKFLEYVNNIYTLDLKLDGKRIT